MKRNDIILIVIILIAAAGGMLYYANMARTPAAEIVVRIGETEYQRLPLNQDAELEIVNADGGTNYLVIQDGYGRVTDASCPDQLCVHQKSIHQTGEVIVCLPNQVTVTVEGGEEADLDGVAQ